MAEVKRSKMSGNLSVIDCQQHEQRSKMSRNLSAIDCQQHEQRSKMSRNLSAIDCQQHEDIMSAKSGKERTMQQEEIKREDYKMHVQEGMSAASSEKDDKLYEESIFMLRGEESDISADSQEKQGAASSNTVAAEETDPNKGIMMAEVRSAASEEKDSKLPDEVLYKRVLFSKTAKPEGTDHDDSIKQNECGNYDSQEEAESTIQKSNPNCLLTKKVKTRRNDDEAQNLGSTKTSELDKDKEAPQELELYCNLAEKSEESGDLYSALKQYELALRQKPDFKLAKDGKRRVQDQIKHKKEECLKDFGFKEEREEMKCDYKTIIKRIQESQSLGRIIDIILSKRNKCTTNTERHILYKLLLDLDPSFFDDNFAQLHENQQNCYWDNIEEEYKRLEKKIELQLLFYDDDEKPQVAPHALATYLPFKPSLIKEVAAKHADYHLNLATNMYKPKLQPCRRSGGRPRIGYVSSDFGNHSLTHLIGGLFELHSIRVEVYLYALSGDDGSEFRQRIEKGKNYIFRDLSRTDFDGRAEYIIDDGIDILINLNGYTRGADNELFALKLAPVRVMWLGYPGTSGSTYMDYIITDPISTPMKYASDSTEKLAYMPSSHFVGDHMKLFAHLIEKVEIRLMLDKETYSVVIINGKDLQPFREACGRAGFTVKGDKERGEYVEVPLLYIIFGNICNVLEWFLPSLLKCLIWNYWRKALLRNDRLSIFGLEVLNGQMLAKSGQKKWLTGELVPDCLIFTARCQYGLPDDKVVFVNFCQNYKFDERTINMWMSILLKVPNSILWLMKCSDKVEPNIRRYVKESGNDINENRIVFSLPVKKEEYIRRCQLADLFLDTPLCNAHTTGVDAIFAGLPLVTLPGRNRAARIAASLVVDIGCPVLIAESEEDYVAISVKLGNNPQFLKETKEKVYKRRSESSLFDPSTKAKHEEDLYIHMYERIHEKPQHITAFVSNKMKAVPPRYEEELDKDLEVSTNMSDYLPIRQRSEQRDNGNAHTTGMDAIFDPSEKASQKEDISSDFLEQTNIKSVPPRNNRELEGKFPIRPRLPINIETTIPVDESTEGEAGNLPFWDKIE